MCIYALQPTQPRFDQYLGSLGTPGVVAVLVAAAAPLSQLFEASIAVEDSCGNFEDRNQLDYSRCLIKLQPSVRALAADYSASCSQVPLEEHRPTLSLQGLLRLLQGRGAVPALLHPADVLEVLKRVQQRNGGMVSCLQSTKPMLMAFRQRFHWVHTFNVHHNIPTECTQHSTAIDGQQA